MKINWQTKKPNTMGENLTTWWSVKKSEIEHQEDLDNFFLTFTPRWFTFVGWLLTLGVLSYIEQNTDSKWIALIYTLSFLILFFFLQSALYNFPFYKLLPSKLVPSRHFAFTFSIVIAGGILLFIQLYLLDHLIDQLSIK